MLLSILVKLILVTSFLRLAAVLVLTLCAEIVIDVVRHSYILLSETTLKDFG